MARHTTGCGYLRQMDTPLAPLCDARPGEGPPWAASPAAHPGRRFGVGRAEMGRRAVLARLRVSGVCVRGFGVDPCCGTFSRGFEGVWVLRGAEARSRPRSRGLGRAGRAARGFCGGRRNRRRLPAEVLPPALRSVGSEHKTPPPEGGVFSPSVDQKGVGSSPSAWTGSGGRMTGRSGAARTTTWMPRSLAICSASALPSASVLQW